MKLAILTGILIVVPACAQSANSEQATLQALLAEVHQLRVTLEKSATLGPRIQLAVQRAQMQEQRVARISQQLDDVRRQVAADTERQTRMSQGLARIEQELANTPEGDHRRQLEGERASFKNAVEAGPDQQLRARESELASSLQIEQAALGELNAKLDAIERQLEPPQQAGR